MDPSPISSQAFSILWYLIPLIIFVATINSAWFKGLAGEFLVNLSSKLLLNKNQYHLIKNVTIPTNLGTTQVDHIIVSVFGVFVVETKNMKGWIFGNQNQKTWTQKIYNHSSKFQNPLHQNYKHVKALESLLGLNNQQVHSVVVFVGNSTFKTDMPENVTHGAGYIKYIESKKEIVLSKSQVNEIIIKIEHSRLTPSFKTNHEHVKHVQNIVTNKASDNAPNCPKCGGSMVLREATKGSKKGNKFWGCTKFPQCRGMINVTEKSPLDHDR